MTVRYKCFVDTHLPILKQNKEVMKNAILGLSFMIGMMISSVGFSQVNVQVNLNSQPNWGPSGYKYVEYYYLPDLDMYYNVNKRKYVYQDHGKWIWVTALPAKHKGYNLYSGYKVVLYDKHPFSHYHQHKVKYAKYKNNHGKQKSKYASAHHKSNQVVHKQQGHGSKSHASKGNGGGHVQIHSGNGKGGHGNGGQGKGKKK